MAKIKPKIVKKPVKKPEPIPIEIPVIEEPIEESVEESIEEPVIKVKPVKEIHIEVTLSPTELELKELQFLRKKMDDYGVSSSGQLDVKIGQLLQALGR